MACVAPWKGKGGREDETLRVRVALGEVRLFPSLRLES